MQPNPGKRERKAEQSVAEKRAAFPPKRPKLSSKNSKESTAPILPKPICPPSKSNQSTKYHSPGFWDALSSISLSHRALQELDRRNSIHTSQPTPAHKPSEGDIRRFARHGGPDLADIKGVSQVAVQLQAIKTAQRSPPFMAVLPDAKPEQLIERLDSIRSLQVIPPRPS